MFSPRSCLLNSSDNYYPILACPSQHCGGMLKILVLHNFSPPHEDITIPHSCIYRRIFLFFIFLIFQSYFFFSSLLGFRSPSSLFFLYCFVCHERRDHLPKAILMDYSIHMNSVLWLTLHALEIFLQILSLRVQNFQTQSGTLRIWQGLRSLMGLIQSLFDLSKLNFFRVFLYFCKQLIIVLQTLVRVHEIQIQNNY